MNADSHPGATLARFASALRFDDIPPHVDDIIAKKPKSVWFQLGIRNDEAAEKLAKAGIDVVQDKCLMVELRHIGR